MCRISTGRRMGSRAHLDHHRRWGARSPSCSSPFQRDGDPAPRTNRWPPGPQKVDVMRMTTALGAVSDRTLNRTIIALALLLAIGLPTIALLYVFDRHVDPGPSIAERQIAAGETAVRSEPNKLSNRLGLALAYAAAQRQTDAIAQFTEILTAEPTDRAALLGRGDAYLATGNLDAAARDYQALVDATDDEEMTAVDPQREAALYGLGSIALKQDRPRDAATFLAKAL